jgi:magnesium chelatase subunit D
MSAVLDAADDATQTAEASPWRDALIAAQLFAVDPAGLCGVALRAGPGPVRDLWTDYLRGVLPANAPVKRMPASIEDDRLLGGVDLAATLKLGRPVVQNGILAEANGGIVLIPMAERLSVGVAARIASTLDRHEVLIEREGVARRIPTSIGVVAFDEGASPEQQLPAALAERFAFHLDISDLSARDLIAPARDAAKLHAARALLSFVKPAADDIIEALVTTAASFGIGSVVAPLLALRAARASAALAGRKVITEDDAILAARLVLAPRALVSPASEQSEQTEEQQQQEEPPPPSGNQEDAEQGQPADLPPLEDVMLAAVQGALPTGLLESLKNGAKDRSPPSRRGGVGTALASPLRGRPSGVRMGQMRPGSRLALVETLRAAAPWQPVRRAEKKPKGTSKRIDVRRDDFRIKKFVQRRESTIVFCVDASGSTAFHRLAEAKGAVELLLAEAYVARTYAALIVFRGTGADLLLPPSRSLTRAKALLSMLPGGGGTPLAAGIDAAVLTALGERTKGREPLIVLLTDGRANIARDGQAVRPRAFNDALFAAKQVAMQRLSSVFVDTSPRAREEGAQLAAAMAARYVALPQVEASAVRDVVRAATT